MKTIKGILFVILFSGVTLLSSCMFPGPGYRHQGGGNYGHEQRGHQGNNGHHGNDDHHDN